ncbi:MAG TPA: WecB/TagA/CpsF family glycosyltransferase [Labilithrix sp.]|jgi:N-acetylglucosaminyldiphosphoundecaprenol N-acetyl-beta-D-mannosaminyltransferase
MGLAEWESSGFDELAQSGEREIARGSRTSMFRVKPREVEHLSAMDALGVAVATCTFEDLRDWFLGATEWRGRFPKAMLFAGARSIAQARRDERHRMRLRRADVVLGEGSAVAAYAKLAAAPNARFDAVETITRLFDAADAERKLRVFLCGEDKERVSRAAKELAERFPAIEIVGAEDARQNGSLAEDVNEACADVVLVGMGGGRDAAWIEENFPLLDVGVVAGVGEALDAFAGETQVAAATRPLGVLATIGFFVRATLYLAFPSRPALPA